jgi:hypothetical protein
MDSIAIVLGDVLGGSVASAVTTDWPGQKLKSRPRKIIGTYGVDDGRRKDLSHAERIKDDERNRGLTLGCGVVGKLFRREDVHIVAAFTKSADQWATNRLCEPTA